GKTNMHELAAGIMTISSLGGQTLNPYDPARTPGGSSGGTGAAVAASFAAAGMGSDTCGSIRIPSANNNLFGLRGTRGLSSRDGIIPLSHTQDIGGPLARSVTDLAIMLDATVGADPADASTAASAGHIPTSYQAALEGATLKDVRIGVLKDLFGDEPEDEEVAAIARKSLAAMAAQGATLVEIAVPGLEERLGGSSLIALEFKTDLIEYLAGAPGAPVSSLAEIVDGGLLHAALVPTLSVRARTEPDPEAIRVVNARRAAVTALVQAAFDEHDLDVMAYPTLRRRPSVVQEAQRGTNCQLSATTGWPAMSVPAGFTDDGVPIGLEVLGGPWQETALLRLAYAYERAAAPRREPPTTPALVNGTPPAPMSFTVALGGSGQPATVAFSYDPSSGELRYEWAVRSAALLSATLHDGAPTDGGPVIARLFNPAAPAASGTIVLPPYQRPQLVAGRFYVAVRLSGQPMMEGQVRLP
ncbi:MAG: amidase, partial [Vicinamibacterales bacterium]